MPQHPLNSTTLNTNPRLPHHLGALPNPDYQDELHALALGVVGVFDAHVGVLRFGGGERAGEFGETAGAGGGEL